MAGTKDVYLNQPDLHNMADSIVKVGDTTYCSRECRAAGLVQLLRQPQSKDKQGSQRQLIADIDLGSGVAAVRGNWIPIASADSGYTECTRAWTGTLTATIVPSVLCISTATRDEQGLFSYTGATSASCK